MICYFAPPSSPFAMSVCATRTIFDVCVLQTQDLTKEKLEGMSPGNSAINISTRFIEYQSAFNFFDSNNDGYITIEELEGAMHKCDQFPTKLELKLLMKQADKDRT
jgi:hypothetical protein